MEKYFKYLIIALFGAVLISLPAGTPVIKSFSEYSSFNTDWNGCSNFTKQLYDSKITITPIYSPYDNYNFDKNGVLFIIGPRLDFTDYEVKKIHDFVKSGNTLVVADDFGTANQILEKLNISDKFTKNRLNDIFYISNENLIEYSVSENYGGGYLVTDIPTYTSKEGVITASNFSTKSNLATLPLISEINYENGKIILIADPDIFINGLYEYNQNFLKNFIEKLNPNQVYIDEIHHKDFEYSISIFYIGKTVSKELVLGILLIVICLSQLNKKLYITAIKKLILKFTKQKPKNENELLENISKNQGIDLNDLKRVIKNIKDGNNGRKRLTK
ncbi:DUF4350 domain-containing protein [Methanococcus sp. CF]